VLVANKIDRAVPEEVERLVEELGAVQCCARDPSSAAQVAREIARRLPAAPPWARDAGEAPSSPEPPVDSSEE
jgi:hypothetical protein